MSRMLFFYNMFNLMRPVHVHNPFKHAGVSRSVVIITTEDGRPVDVIMPDGVPENEIPPKIRAVVDEAKIAAENDRQLKLQLGLERRKFERLIVNLLEMSIIPRKDHGEVLLRCYENMDRLFDRKTSNER
jgi:hypothetical protein